jgi:mannose-6-phosphate isomerase-like protein (cupin superfamily)
MKAGVIRPDPAHEYWSSEGCFSLEMSNSSGDDALSIARARVRAGDTTRSHRLLDTAERYVIQQGHGRVQIGNQAPLVAAPGDVVLIPPGVGQRITNVGAQDLVFLAICTPRFRSTNYVEDHSG